MAHFFKEYKSYPSVIVSNEIQRLLSAEIPLSIEEPKAPSEPVKEKSTPIGCLIIPLPFILLLLILKIIPLEFLGTLVTLLLIAIVIFWIKEATKNNEKYASKMEEHKVEISKFRKLKEEWIAEKNRVRTHQNTINYRQSEILRALKNARKPNQPSVNKRGRRESHFENYLNRWFKGQIFTGYSFNTPDEYRPYQPDFIYQNEENIHIDIEIDEPYINDSKTPIHYLDENGTSIDEMRDAFFADGKGWIVIRFSEEQVVLQPTFCCNFIAYILHELTGKNYTQINSLGSTMKKAEKWTFLEAEEMGKKNYRLQYQPRISDPEISENTWNHKIVLDNKTDFNIGHRKLNGIPTNTNQDDDLPF